MRKAYLRQIPVLDKHLAPVEEGEEEGRPQSESPRSNAAPFQESCQSTCVFRHKTVRYAA